MSGPLWLSSPNMVRRGGEGFVDACNLVLAVSFFCLLLLTNLYLALSPFFSYTSPACRLKMTVIWIVLLLHEYILIQIFWMHFHILRFNHTGWSRSLGRKQSQNALIITSCFHHLSPKVLCLSLPYASIQKGISWLVLEKHLFSPLLLMASTHFPKVVLILFT